MINDKHREPERKRPNLQEPVKKPIRQCPNSARHHIRNRFSPWSADVFKVSEIIVKTDSVLYSSEGGLTAQHKVARCFGRNQNGQKQ